MVLPRFELNSLLSNGIDYKLELNNQNSISVSDWTNLKIIYNHFYKILSEIINKKLNT